MERCKINVFWIRLIWTGVTDLSGLNIRRRDIFLSIFLFGCCFSRRRKDFWKFYLYAAHTYHPLIVVVFTPKKKKREKKNYYFYCIRVCNDCWLVLNVSYVKKKKPGINVMRFLTRKRYDLLIRIYIIRYDTKRKRKKNGNLWMRHRIQNVLQHIKSRNTHWKIRSVSKHSLTPCMCVHLYIWKCKFCLNMFQVYNYTV